MPPKPSQPEAAEPPRFVTYQCTRAGCGLRYSLQVTVDAASVDAASVDDQTGEARCPLCRAPVAVAAESYARLDVPPLAASPRGPQLEVLLDNIRSAWNVGSMLRSADGAGVRRVHLCGVTALPDNPKVWKTSLGAENSLPWTFHRDGLSAARALKDGGARLWALEGGPRAELLFDAPRPSEGSLVLVVGNELSGVDPGILALCERVVCLPMQGVKGSLNVAVAFGAALYALRFGR